MNTNLTTIEVNDCLFELKDENNRLLNELLLAQKCIQLLDDYRNCLNSFNNKCNCIENIENKLVFNELENKYKTIFNEQIKVKFCQKFSQKLVQKKVNKKRNKNKQNSNKSKFNKNSNYYALIDKQIVVKSEDIESNDNNIEENYSQNNISSQTVDSTLYFDEINEEEEEDEDVIEDKESSEEMRNKLELHLNICESTFNSETYNDLNEINEEEEEDEDVIEDKESQEEIRNKLELHLSRCESTFNSETYNGLKSSKKNTEIIDFQIQCDVCGKRFNTKNKLNKHKRYLHSNKTKIFKCLYPECMFETKYKDNLENHKIRLHLRVGDKPFKCDECDACYSSKAYLLVHKSSEHLNIKYKCTFTDCVFEGKTTYGLNKHIKRVHSNIKNFVCEWPGCESRFCEKNSLDKHQNRVHKNIKQYKCDWTDCDQEFNCSRLLESHVNRIHKKLKPYKCDKCPASYAGLRQYRDHIRINHSQNAKEYKCEDCDYKTKRSQTLKMHFLRHHSGIKPFKCVWIGCQSCFVTNFELQEHQKCMHSNDRPFLCEWPECEASFKFKQNLILHSRTHTGEKPFACEWPDCAKRYKSKSDLKTHLTVHYGKD